MLRPILTSIVAILFSSSVNADWFGPDDYDECILESMKGVTSDSAAKSIRQSCSAKFPTVDTKSNKYEQLSRDALSKIDTKARWNNAAKNELRVEIYNGNENWRIFSLTVRLTDKASGKYRDYKGLALSQYGMNVSAQANGFLTVELFEVPKEFTWAIVGGEGYKY